MNFKKLKNCARKIKKKDTSSANSKMVKSFLGRSNNNFVLNELTSMIDMPCRIIIEKFQLLKQGFRFITTFWAHSTH